MGTPHLNCPKRITKSGIGGASITQHISTIWRRQQYRPSALHRTAPGALFDVAGKRQFVKPRDNAAGLETSLQTRPIRARRQIS